MRRSAEGDGRHGVLRSGWSSAGRARARCRTGRAPSRRLVDQVLDRRRPVVEARRRRQDRRARLGHGDHVAQVDQAERGLAWHEHERPALLQRDAGGAREQVVLQPVGDRGERPHGAGRHDHPHREERSRRDRGREVAGLVDDVGQRLDVGDLEVGLQLDRAVGGRSTARGGSRRSVARPSARSTAMPYCGALEPLMPTTRRRDRPVSPSALIVSLPAVPGQTETGPAEPAFRRASASSTVAGGGVPSIPTSLATLLPM